MHCDDTEITEVLYFNKENTDENMQIPIKEPIVNHDSLCDFSVGSIIAKQYKILELFWKSGLYKVYLARDIHSGIFYSMKVYDEKIRHNPLYHKLMKDIEAMAKFHHPAIQRIRDVLTFQQHMIIIQEYVEGVTLSDIVKKNGVQDVKNVVEWGKQLCDGLQYLHTCNPPYIHCDVKPANIILMSNGRLKLIDLWNMREIHSPKNKDIILVTKGYAPTEQYTGENLDAKADIFALGMTMHYLLTGIDPTKPPYTVKPIREWNPELPKKLEKIICKCTEVKPKNRYQSCEEILKDLNKIKIIDNKNFFEKLTYL